MRVAEVTTTPVVAVTAAATVAEAGRVMTERKVTTLPVVDPDGRLPRLLSEAEVVRAGDLPERASGPDGDAVLDRHGTAGASVRAPGFGVDPGTELTEVAAVMVERQVRSLPVLEGDRAIGMVTWRDLLRALAPPT
jgi:CBS domain-containing protein